MLFNSLGYLLFLLTIWTLYWVLPTTRARHWLLLAASLYFYASWKPAYLLLILFTTVSCWALALWLERHTGRQKWAGVATAVGLNLLILFLFKYWDFFRLSLHDGLALMGLDWCLPEFPWALPVGISFYTFQSLGYVIDVYRGHTRAERNLLTYTLFVTFFPQLVAGPIERSRQLLTQFHTPRHFNAATCVSGFQLIALGLVKKAIIADNLALAVDTVFAHLDTYQGLSLLLTAGLFAVQIWGDFSGYTDIARGSARLFGFHLMENFHTPYLATSITDFWRRWHISLSTWLHDYVYLPLGGKSHGRARTCLNLFLVFVISGLWHGANWTFVVWGAYFGALIVVERLWYWYQQRHHWSWRLPHWLAVLSTDFLVVLGWILFRADSLSQALQIYRQLLVGLKNIYLPSYWWASLVQIYDHNFLELWLGLGCVLAAVVIEGAHACGVRGTTIARWPTWWRYSLYLLVMVAIVMLRHQEVQEFIYFQF